MNKFLHKKWFRVLAVIFLLIFLSLIIALIFYFVNAVKNYKNSDFKFDNPVNAISKAEQEKIIGDGYWIGSNNPKITIVEFGDFACLMCKNSFSKIRELGIKYKDDVKIVFRDFPVISENSMNLAIAARCAGEQGFFWVMHDKLFINQGKSSTIEIKEMAEQIGLDIDRFNNCFDSKKYISAINKDLEMARELNIKGTPTWFINGNKVSGDVPYNIFLNIIEELLDQ